MEKTKYSKIVSKEGFALMVNGIVCLTIYRLPLAGETPRKLIAENTERAFREEAALRNGTSEFPKAQEIFNNNK